MLAGQIEVILLITGLATAGAVVVFLAPGTMMKLLFGQAPSDALGMLIARHWGLLLFLVGALLVYAAYNAAVRPAALAIAVAEKVPFVLGLLVSPLRSRPAALVMAVADGGMAAVYLVYLIGRVAL
jgi:hypothetical protein